MTTAWLQHTQFASNDYWIMFDLWFTVYRKPASANILLHIHIRQIHTEMFQHGDPKIYLTRQNGKFWHAIHQTAGIKTPSKFRSFCICQVPNSARLTSSPIEPTRQGLKSVVFENITCKASSPEESSGRFWLGEQVKEWWTHDDLLNIDIIEEYVLFKLLFLLVVVLFHHRSFNMFGNLIMVAEKTISSEFAPGSNSPTREWRNHDWHLNVCFLHQSLGEKKVSRL